MAGAGVGIRGWCAVEIPSGHFCSVYVCDKTVVVPNIQCHRIECVRIAAIRKRDTDITSGVHAVHLFSDVEADESLVTRVCFVSDPAGWAGASCPASVVIVCRIFPGAAEGANRNEHSFISIFGDEDVSGV